MKSVFFSPLAKEDLYNIWDFIANDSPQSTKKVIDKIYTNLQKLSEFPDLGHTRSDLTQKDVKFWTVYRYLIVYKIEKEEIHIVRILSGFRDIALLLES